MPQQRRRFRQPQSLEERLSDEAKRLREQAKLLPPGAAREQVLRKARQCETGSHMSEWLLSPGLRPPKWEPSKRHARSPIITDTQTAGVGG
jgi:hypothetical protein